MSGLSLNLLGLPPSWGLFLSGVVFRLKGEAPIISPRYSAVARELTHVPKG